MEDLVKISEDQIREAVAEKYHLITSGVCLYHDYEFVKRGGDKVRRDFLYGIIDTRCSKPFINADKIRSMTDEELAAWLEDRTMLPSNGLWLDWLKQEAET